MPRQRNNYDIQTYNFTQDFPERLERFQEESGMSWSEIARRIGTYRSTVSRWKRGGGPPQHGAHDGPARPGRKPGPPPYLHRLRRRGGSAINAKRAAYIDGRGRPSPDVRQPPPYLCGQRQTPTGSSSLSRSKSIAHSNIERVAGCGLRPRPLGLTGSSARNSAQE